MEQRNLALSWIRRRMKREPGKAIVYFMDDDNSYSVELFEEMSTLKPGKIPKKNIIKYLDSFSCDFPDAVGVWPVGLVGALNVEKPIVKDGKVVGFNSMWKPGKILRKTCVV